MTARRTGALVLVLLVLTPGLWAAIRHIRAERAFDLVRRAATAHARVSFEGTAAWVDGKGAHGEITIVHDAESGASRYGYGRRRSYVTPRPSPRAPDPSAFCLDVEALEQSYRASDRGSIRAIDRPARLLVLEPRHEGRPTLHVAVDERTGLPLRVTSYRSDGTRYRECAFLALAVGPQDLRPDERSFEWLGVSVAEDDLEETAGFPVALPDYLPAGFRLAEARLLNGPARSLRLIYTDGCTVFEITQNRVPTPAQLEASTRSRHGPAAAARFMARYRARGMSELARADEETPAGRTLVRCWKQPTHRTYSLRLDDLDVRITARADLAADEVLHVLRSLQAE